MTPFPGPGEASSSARPAEVNAIANFTFLTRETNLRVSDRAPAVYLEEFVTRYPGAVESHWIPMDRTLWSVENYPAFLTARRELLANAANQFLDQLRHGRSPDLPVKSWGDGSKEEGCPQSPSPAKGWLAARGDPFRMEIVRRPEGFVKLPKRWVVERSLAWLGRDRRHSKDYERTPQSSQAWVRISSIRGMLRRLAPDEKRPAVSFKYPQPKDS